MISFIVTASFVLISVLLMDETSLNSPTPLEKSIGLPAGSALTLIFIAGVWIVFFTSM